MQLFANVLQNKCYYKFPDILKKKSVLESQFNKVTGLMAATSKKDPNTVVCPVNITKCLRKAFFMEHLWCLLLKMVEEFLRISNGGLTRKELYHSTNLNV